MLESYPINLFPGSIWPICWPASLQVQGFENWRNIPPAKLTLRPSERQRIIQAPCPGWVQVGPFETMSTWTWVQEQFAYIFWFNTFAWLTQSQINSPTVVLSCHRMIGPTGCCMPSKIDPLSSGKTFGMCALFRPNWLVWVRISLAIKVCQSEWQKPSSFGSWRILGILSGGPKRAK